MVPGPPLWHHRGIGTTLSDHAAHPSDSRSQGGWGFRLVRGRTDRIIAGVASGLGAQLGVDPVVIRLAFVVLAFAGGAGVVAYLVMWVLSREEDTGPAPLEDRRAAWLKTIAVAAMVAGALLLLRSSGAWFGDAVVWPVALGALGSAVIWVRAGEHRRERWARAASRHPVERVFTGELSRGRIALGALFIAGGMGVFLAANNAFTAARNVVFAAGVTAVGLLLIVGPGMWRLGRQLSEERRGRIRSEERAEVAAHLHDSVLQSLAMIQRASSPQEMASLARAQERELRTWLYGRKDGDGDETLAAAMEDAAGRVEQLHHVSVEVVTVGNATIDGRVRALIQACGEAMTNAARHAAVTKVSVYVEASNGSVTAYVRDRGRGFEPAAVSTDRRGIAESIRGRMERAGGSAEISSRPGSGTEVKLTLPVGGR